MTDLTEITMMLIVVTKIVIPPEAAPNTMSIIMMAW